MSKNLSQMEFQAFFIHTFSLFGQKQVLVRIYKKLAIFRKQSLKNDKQDFFSNKIQNAHSIWFPHRFSILSPNVTPKGPPDGHGPPWQLKWDSFVAMGLLARILIFRQSLVIYPCEETCSFFLPPTYF